MRFVRVGAAVLAAAAIVGTQSGVASAAVWSPTKTLQGVFGISSPPEAPSVASNAAGHGVAVWDNTGVVRLAERVKGGAWTASRTVFPGSAWYGGPSTVAIGADETTAVAWTTVATRYVPAKLVVSVRRPGADFTTPVQVAPGFLVFSFRLGVAADGTVTLAWLDGSGVHASTLAPGGAWSAPQQLSGAGYPSLPDLVVNDAGAAVAVWQQGSSPGAPSSVVAAYRPAGAAAFDAAQVVSAGTGQSTWNPKPGISASGDAAVGYLDGASMVVATRPAAGPWGAPVTVSPASHGVGYPALAMDGAGDLVAAWLATDTFGTPAVWKRTMPAGGAWTATTRLSGAADTADWPTAAFSSDGSVAVVTWIDDQALKARASTGSVSGAWTRATLGAGYWGSTVPVAAGGGTATAAWAAAIPTNANSSKILGRAFG